MFFKNLNLSGFSCNFISAKFLLNLHNFSSTDSFKQELLSKRDFHLRYNEMKVNLEMYPKPVTEGSVKSLKYLLNSPNLKEKMQSYQDIHGLQSVQGSFRRLEID